MRCPKCGFISFDFFPACKSCKRDLSEQSGLFMGTTSSEEAPFFLGPALGPMTVDGDIVEPAGYENESPTEGIDFGMESEEASTMTVGDEEAGFDFQMDTDEDAVSDLEFDTEDAEDFGFQLDAGDGEMAGLEFDAVDDEKVDDFDFQLEPDDDNEGLAAAGGDEVDFSFGDEDGADLSFADDDNADFILDDSGDKESPSVAAKKHSVGLEDLNLTDFVLDDSDDEESPPSAAKKHNVGLEDLNLADISFSGDDSDDEENDLDFSVDDETKE